MLKQKPSVVPGLLNKIAAKSVGFLPRPMVPPIAASAVK